MNPKRQKKSRKESQLELFNPLKADGAPGEVHELEKKITRSLRVKDIALAKHTAKKQEKLLKDFIARKKGEPR